MWIKAVAMTITDNGRKTKVNQNPEKLGEATVPCDQRQLQIP